MREKWLGEFNTYRTHQREENQRKVVNNQPDKFLPMNGGRSTMIGRGRRERDYLVMVAC